jgi:hypothetical protein
LVFWFVWTWWVSVAFWSAGGGARWYAPPHTQPRRSVASQWWIVAPSFRRRRFGWLTNARRGLGELELGKKRGGLRNNRNYSYCQPVGLYGKWFEGETERLWKNYLIIVVRKWKIPNQMTWYFLIFIGITARCIFEFIGLVKCVILINKFVNIFTALLSR